MVLKDKWRNLVKYLNAKDDRSRLPPELKARIRAVVDTIENSQVMAQAQQAAAVHQSYLMEQAQMMHHHQVGGQHGVRVRVR